MTEQRDYRDTVFLPKTDFPMKAGLPAKEPGILARWQDMGIYDKLRDQRRGREKFILHDGPPYANGDMHIGHALNHILKDMVVRTQSLLGKDAPYVPGWDCHGLPIEWKVEEEYRKKKRNKDEVPPDEFRAECRAYAQHWVNTQREQLKRLGINADWDHPYLTMDFDAEATIVTELMKFAESGQLYRGAKPVMWSPVEKTALAEAEVEYEDIVSTQIDVAFEITHCPNVPELVGAYAVIWTTTPWTIPVNQAIAYGPDIEYVLVDILPELGALDGPADLTEQHSFVAADRLKSLGVFPSGPVLVAGQLINQLLGRLRARADEVSFSDMGAQLIGLYFNRILKVKGSDLAGTIARHPMAKHFASPPAGEAAKLGEAQPNLVAAGEGGVAPGVGAPDPSPSLATPASPSPARGEGTMAEFFLRPRPFLDGSDFVTTDSGTGLVHMAPDHGEDDFDLCKANGIEPVFAVQGDGKYREDWAWLGGQGSVINPKFNAPDGPICSDLRESGGLLAASSDYKHSYPHSWRSKAKVIYRCTPQWFVPMDRELVAPAQAGASAGVGSQGVTQAPALAGATLRETALTAISATRWVPEKGQNRITAMVEGRPDWVLSRQRAWGVPITLFVDRKTGQYLCDPAVNARIIAAVRETGVDAWCDARAQEYLGSGYNAADYERVADILDVWFDSGCTHAFVLESGKWPDLVREGPADLYLEGSDQHRGWFQSSLLESCGTRGRAPYKAVLTHGFTMDQKGMKMSKSLGNTINPLDLMRDYGADILRLWALSVDFTEDHRIGKEILTGVSDQYRKLRNTFRYLLGALEGFTEAERVDLGTVPSGTVPDSGAGGTVPEGTVPELERYVLHLLADLDAKLKGIVERFDGSGKENPNWMDFGLYTRLLSDFANNDLSAFFFDIRKDSLYCDAANSPKRMAYRTVLDTLFHALVRYAAPVLVFTAEEVWQTRFPDAGNSVHFLEWPEVDAGWRNEELSERHFHWNTVRMEVSAAVEPKRREKLLGSSLQAKIRLGLRHTLDQQEVQEFDLAEYFIVSSVRIDPLQEDGFVEVTITEDHKCGRCWRHLPDVGEDGALCGRCEDVVNG